MRQGPWDADDRYDCEPPPVWYAQWPRGLGAVIGLDERAAARIDAEGGDDGAMQPNAESEVSE